MSLISSLTSLFVLVFAGSAALVACGDDSTGTGGGGGEGPSTSSSTSQTSSSSGTPTSSSSSTTSTGGQGPGGGGAGGGGAGGSGSGGGEPATCTLGDLVQDDFSYDAEIVAPDGHYECAVEGVDASSPTIEVILSCFDGDDEFEVTLSYSAVPALEGEFPLTPGQLVTFDDLSEEEKDIPPVSEGYVVRSTATGKLLFSWIYGSSLAPPLADADWSDPLTIIDVEGLCTPDEDAYEHRALDVSANDEAPVRIFSDEIAIVAGGLDDYEIRVSDATYNDEIDGGFSRLFRYAILSPEQIIEE